MSGLPKAVIIWDSGVPSYPAGSNPWSGTITANQPAYNFFTPGLPAAAQEINFLLNDLSQKASDEHTWLGNIAAMNWPYDPGVWTGYQDVASWQDNIQQWMLSTVAVGPVADILTSHDGRSWSSTLGYSGVSGAGRWISVIFALGMRAVIAEFNGSTNSRIAVYNPAGLGGFSYTTFIYPFFETGCAFQGLPLLAGQDNTGTHMTVYTGDSAAATWTQTLNSLLSGCGLSAKLAASPTTALLMTSIGPAKCFTSPDGSSWTAHDLTGLLPNTAFISALAYSDVDKVFMMTVLDNTGVTGFEGNNPTKVYTSPDGITWALKATLANTTLEGLVAAGALWLASARDRTAAFSIDQGATWHKVWNPVLASDSSTRTGAYGENVTRPGVAFNGSQFLIWNGKNAVGSLITGPSGLVT